MLNGTKSHLNDDQLYLACDFLGLSHDETNFLFQLKNYQKSEVAKHRSDIARRLDEIRTANLKTDKYLSQKSLKVSSDEWNEYFLNPNVMLVHIFLTIKKYRNDLDLIATKLRLSKNELQLCLTRLEKLDIIRLGIDGYEVLNDNTHLSKDSSIYSSFRMVQRLKAIEKFGREITAEDDSYSLSVTFSTSAEIRKTIQEKILDLVSEVETLVKKSDNDDGEVCQFNLDLFSWC